MIHAVGIDARDVETLRSAGASVVWSPRSNIDLYGDTAPITELVRAGLPLALGTDWLATGSMNLFRELSSAESLADKYFPGAYDSAALVRMVTSGAARSVG